LDLRKRIIWVAALTLAVAGVQLVATRRKAEQREGVDIPLEARRSLSPTGPTDRAVDPLVAPAQRAPVTSAERVHARAERDALREKILRSQPSVPATSGPAAAPPRPDLTNDADRPGQLKDRTPGRDQLAAHLDRELTPLAHECIQQAKARSPSLRGVLTLRLETVSDEQLGAIVEGAEVPVTSEVQERGLAACIREHAMTLTFPPPVSRGPDHFELSFMIRPPSAAQ
jgi:hypothetical protein